MEESSLVGRKGKLSVGTGTLQMDVVIREARKAYGRIDVRVEPIAGSGSAWVRRSSLRLVQEEK